MKLSKVSIRNFRRLENVEIDIEDKQTIFVGPNNSGKTSATTIFRCFLGGRDFTIHDFSVARLTDFEQFSVSSEESALPKISLDLWFTIDPNKIEFGVVGDLLPRLSDLTQVGIRLSYGIEDPKKLLDQYFNAYPTNDRGERAKTLFQYLSSDSNLNRHSIVRYESLEKKTDISSQNEVTAIPLAPDEGKRLVKHLIRVEFIDAQRNINDDDNSRSNRLSTAFASYYRKNLEQADYAAEAHRVIDENNRLLTDHYLIQFKPLINLIKVLGVPSVNDRELRIISSLSPETALRGNTELLYVDPTLEHALPELYNGLGFKNLIYMAIQARHFHSQWLLTKENRPLCLIIFIEEPEVHLHAQVQQTFIVNIWKVINESAKEANTPDIVPQLVVTTHSSHVLDAVEFENVRYFQRSHLIDKGPKGIRNESDVKSLREFQPEVDIVDERSISPTESVEFLKRYLRLTHCDLFFADGAILVEGAVEKLLMSSMIEKSAKKLRSTYLTVLEVGGAYAYRFEGLLAFLRIPYLIITDLDSVVTNGRPKVCRADLPGARTSNASLKKLCDKKTVDDLIKMSTAEKINTTKDRAVAFQADILVKENGDELLMRPRTLEEAIAYENFANLRSGAISLGISIPKTLPEAYTDIYELINSNNFKKTDFAMSLLAGNTNWIVPQYIIEGLRWLENRLYETASSSNSPGLEQRITK